MYLVGGRARRNPQIGVHVGCGLEVRACECARVQGRTCATVRGDDECGGGVDVGVGGGGGDGDDDNV